MAIPLRVLIVEDSPSDAALDVRALEKAGYKVTHEIVATAKEMKAALQTQTFDLIISDHDLPQFDSLKALVVLKESGQDIPFILVSGVIGEETAVKIMKAGAHDYVMKGNLQRLAPAIERELNDTAVRRERKKAEEALKESEERFRSSMENAPDGIYINDLEGNFLYGNRKCEELIGYSREELIGKNFLELNILPEDSLARAAELLQANIEGRSTGPDELELIRKDGSRVPVEINTSLLQRQGQNVVLAFARDITERKLAKENIEHLNRVLRALRNVNQLITKENDRDKLLKGACVSMTKSRGYISAWIALFDDAGKLLFTTESGLGKAFLPVLKRLKRGELTECGRHVLRQSGLFIKDRSSACADCPLATTRGEKVAMAARLEYGTRTYGMLAVSLPADLTTDIEEQSLFQELVDDIAFGLYTLEMEEQRTRTEEALRQSEEKYRTILKEMEDSYFEVDLAGNLTFVNDSTCRNLAYSREELLGLNYRSFTVEENIKDVYQVFNEVYRTGEPNKGFPWEIVRKDRSLGFVEASASVLRDHEGKIIGFRGVGRDVTQRKQAEEVLRGSEQRLKEAQALGRIGSWEFDLATQKIEWSDEVYVLYERDKALGPPSPEEEAGYYPPEEAKRLREFARLATETGEQFDYGLMAKLPSGKSAFFDATMRPIKDREGRVIKLFGTVQDVTDREKADEVIEKQREEYRTIFDAVRPMIAYLDRDGSVLRINRAGASVFGLEPKEVIGKTLYDLFPPDEAETFARGNMAVISSGEPRLGVVTQYTRPSGEKMWAQVDTIPYRDEHGQIIGVIQFNQDITRRKLAEENLIQSYEKLQKTLESAVEAMASIAEIRDPYTAGHQMRVTKLACAIAAEMGLSAEIISDLRMAGALHDIGKMQVPAEILSKPGKLTELEFSMIKNHSQTGYDIVKKIELPCSVATVVLNHHERLDGSGYPKGLRGEEIPLEAKILAVSDVVEAMASHRPYRPALGIDKALDEISLNRGKLYDPDVADTCLRLFSEKGFKFE